MIEIEFIEISTLGELKEFIENLPDSIKNNTKIESVHGGILAFQYTSIEGFIVSINKEK